MKNKTANSEKILTDEDYRLASEVIGCDIAIIKAVAIVEAPRGGFNPDGTPVTLFEGHWFWHFTSGRFGYSDISYERWTRKHYGKTWKQEQNRIERAIKLDRVSALKSASWGKFQIMGFNYKKCGFKTIQGFVNAMYHSEGKQLKAFVNFIKHSRLDDELRDRNFARFAYFYNGKKHYINKYAPRMERAYLRYSS